MSFPRYPKYKDSGVGWLGEVPEHWEAMSLRRCLLEHRQGYYSDSAYVDSGAKLLRITDLRDFGRIAFDECPRVELCDDLTPFFLKESDFVFARTGGAGTFGLVEALRGPIVYASYLIRFRFTERTIPKFLRHFFLSSGFQEAVRQNIHGGVNQNIHAEDIKNQFLVLPPAIEQTRIAEFLDRETGKIDELVAEQQRLMELLKEKRQAVISQAVTKGLNPRAPMKPSGIEWLGDVPAHWEVTRLKKISPSMTVGIVVNPSSFIADEGLPFIYGGDIREGVIDWANARRIDAKSSEANSKTQMRAGDLLTVRVGAPGVTAVVPTECEGGNCASVMLIRQGAFNSQWLCYAMNTRTVRFQVEVVQYGAAQEQFNISHAVNFWVPAPPRKEQNEIVKFLDDETAKLAALAAEAQKAIDLLQERRTALISAAVTGQIDVRKLAAA